MTPSTVHACQGFERLLYYERRLRAAARNLVGDLSSFGVISSNELSTTS